METILESWQVSDASLGRCPGVRVGFVERPELVVDLLGVSFWENGTGRDASGGFKGEPNLADPRHTRLLDLKSEVQFRQIPRFQL